MQAPFRYYRFYKPYGYLSQFKSNDPKEIRKALLLSKLSHLPEDVMPVGRLDKDSEGLLLLTDDGNFSNWVNSSGVLKTYLVTVDGLISQEQVERLKLGVTLNYGGKPFLAKAKEAFLINRLPSYLPEADYRIRLNAHRKSSILQLSIAEGKFRQIRKMTAAIGFPTLRLIRTQVGGVSLHGLMPAEFEPIKSTAV